PCSPFSCLCTLLSSLLPRYRPASSLFPYTTLFRSRLRDYYVVALQVHDDLNLLNNGNGWTMERLIDEATRSFATHAPSHQRLLRSEEHTSELQSPDHLVCRLLLEKKIRY